MAILWERLNDLYVETLDEIPLNLTLVVCCLGKVLARSWQGLGWVLVESNRDSECNGKQSAVLGTCLSLCTNH